MRSISLIARNVVRECVRRRILYVLVMFAVALLATLEVLARFEADLQVKMVKDFGYTILSFFGLAITILITADQIPDEVDSKTIYLVLARPLPRRTLIAGKFVGVLTVVSGILALLSLILVGMTAVLAREQKILLDLQLVQAVFLLILKYSVFASLLMVLVLAFSRPVAISLGLLIHFFGHMTEALQLGLAQSKAAIVRMVFQGLEFVLPNYAMFDVSESFVSKEIFSPQALAVLTLYAGLFCLLYLMIATWLLSSKDL